MINPTRNVFIKTSGSRRKFEFIEEIAVDLTPKIGGLVFRIKL